MRAAHLILLILLILPLLIGPVSSVLAEPPALPALHPEERALLAQTQQFFEANTPDKARQLLERHFQSADSPDPAKAPHPALFLALGNARYLCGDLPGAHAALSTAHAAMPFSAPACRNLALAAYGLERWTESAELFECAAALLPPEEAQDRGALWQQAALAWNLAGNGAQTLRAIRKALAVTPNPPLALLDLHAHLHTLHGEHESGLLPLKRVVAERAADSRLWTTLAEAEQRGQRFARAAATLEAALRLLPPDNEARADLYARLDALYATANLPAEVARLLERHAAPTASAAQLDRLAELLARAQLPDKALDAFRKAQALQPRSERLRQMALLCRQHGRTEQAAALFESYLLEKPEDHEARLLLALALLAERKKGGTLAALASIPQTSSLFPAAEQLRELLAPTLPEEPR